MNQNHGNRLAKVAATPFLGAKKSGSNLESKLGNTEIDHNFISVQDANRIIFLELPNQLCKAYIPTIVTRWDILII